MNFIIDLLKSTAFESVKYDCILMMINRLFKMTRFISCRKIIISKQLTHLMLREIIATHELSDSIVTDRDSVFASDF